MTSAPASVTIACPTCGQKIEVPTKTDSMGLQHPPLPMPTEVLTVHCFCDIWRIIEELSAAAFRQSKVTVYSIKGDDE